jgi:hypothetical protein
MPDPLVYPQQPYSNEIPFWCIFKCAEYSVINKNRTRQYIRENPLLEIWLPFTSEPKMRLEHEFASGANPVGPVASMAGLKNTSGGDDVFLERLSAPAAAFYEAAFTTDTYRRFSNITEATMTSEARRNFSFKYLFVPKNPAESEAVDQIVNSFKNYSYPKVVPELPERTFPQNLWVIDAFSNGDVGAAYLTNSWLGDPLPCVLSSLQVDKGDPADPVLKVFKNARAVITLLTVTFTEFETGTFAPAFQDGVLLSKSEVSALGAAVG